MLSYKIKRNVAVLVVLVRDRRLPMLGSPPELASLATRKELPEYRVYRSHSSIVPINNSSSSHAEFITVLLLISKFYS